MSNSSKVYLSICLTKYMANYMFIYKDTHKWCDFNNGCVKLILIQ